MATLLEAMTIMIPLVEVRRFHRGFRRPPRLTLRWWVGPLISGLHWRTRSPGGAMAACSLAILVLILVWYRASLFSASQASLSIFRVLLPAGHITISGGLLRRVRFRAWNFRTILSP